MIKNTDSAKDYYKVKKVESGSFEYDTVFIEIDGKEVQVPILKSAYKAEEITDKSIKILLGNVIEKVETL